MLTLPFHIALFPDKVHLYASVIDSQNTMLFPWPKNIKDEYEIKGNNHHRGIIIVISNFNRCKICDVSKFYSVC